jgi:cyclophilin family peptidyl-prolyl cis-trans isomerase
MRDSAEGATLVRFETSLGGFNVQLFDDAMPRTVNNFLAYVNSGRYDGTAIHRNSDSRMEDFVIQGGGFTFADPVPPDPSATMSSTRIVADPPIADEPGGGVAGPSNVRRTLAMSKSGPNTVTSQWYFNQSDNSVLDDPSRTDGGYSAFGRVLGDGMQVVDAIGDLPVPVDFGFAIAAPFNDLPLRDFSGSSIRDVRVANTVTVDSISQLIALDGDINLDGQVDRADFDILFANFGLSSGAFLDQGDADMDGDVDGDDLAILRSQVPEPTAGLLAMITVLAVPRARRQQGANQPQSDAS